MDEEEFRQFFRIAVQDKILDRNQKMNYAIRSLTHQEVEEETRKYFPVYRGRKVQLSKRWKTTMIFINTVEVGVAKERKSRPSNVLDDERAVLVTMKNQ